MEFLPHCGHKVEFSENVYYGYMCGVDEYWRRELGVSMEGV